MKECRKCRRVQEKELFRHGRRVCRSCDNYEANRWYRENREIGLRARKDSNLRRTFGITIEDYEELLSKQNGVCQICHKAETSRTQYGLKSLAVDHCHRTGKIRGLLCEKCNRALGQFGEDVVVLRSAIKYIRKHLS